MASLFVIRGRDQGKHFELNLPVISLGRDGANTIQLHDTEISRRHAEIREQDGKFQLVDLQSSNGTFVNSNRVTEHLLASGDRVQVGRSMLIFTAPENSSSIGIADGIDIVGSLHASRIVKSISHDEGSQLLADFEVGESPWLARARSNLQVMYRTALAVSHTLDIDQLLHRILELIFEWVEADRGCVMLMDQETDELMPSARRNRRGVNDDDKISISRTILDYVLEHREGVHTSDARDDERWDPGGSIVRLGVREAICVPMQGRYGIVGVIYIDTYTPPGRSLQQRPSNRFSEEHLKLMVAIAHQAALAVEDTSYYSAMVQAERLAAIGQTIATLSHHIKNILQGIRGGSYLIEEGLKQESPDVVRKGWRIVEKNQEKISNLVMDMLSFSKERQPEMEPNCLNEVVADVVELMQVRAKDMNVRLEFQPATDLPKLCFDSDAIHRAVLNVVTNAIDACEHAEHGLVSVWVELTDDGETARMLVQDNGTGIAEEDLKRIFSVFESRKGSRGTGLGLPVSQKILREHHGDIRVESSPQAGSRFIMEMPAVRPSAPKFDSDSNGDTMTLS